MAKTPWWNNYLVAYCYTFYNLSTRYYFLNSEFVSLPGVRNFIVFQFFFWSYLQLYIFFIIFIYLLFSINFTTLLLTVLYFLNKLSRCFILLWITWENQGLNLAFKTASLSDSYNETEMYTNVCTRVQNTEKGMLKRKVDRKSTNKLLMLNNNYGAQRKKLH